jgi:hypothetical protein
MGRYSKIHSLLVMLSFLHPLLFLRCPPVEASFEGPLSGTQTHVQLRRAFPHFLKAAAPRPSNEPEWTSTTLARHKITGVFSNNDGQFLSKTLLPITLFLLQSFLIALVYVSWEDLTCSYTLPSRQTTSLLKDGSWGTSTVRGLGFGQAQRLNLGDPDELVELVPSFNEVMLQHRQERVPRWRSTSRTVADAATVSQATHTLLECLQTITNLQESAADYQWDTIRSQLRSAPLTQLEPAANALRTTVDKVGDAVVGFDWAACAWRHCGALADAQEAIDEVEHLLGVLEPFEAIFCLDIVERSLRGTSLLCV